MEPDIVRIALQELSNNKLSPFGLGVFHILGERYLAKNETHPDTDRLRIAEREVVGLKRKNHDLGRRVSILLAEANRFFSRSRQFEIALARISRRFVFGRRRKAVAALNAERE